MKERIKEKRKALEKHNFFYFIFFLIERIIESNIFLTASSLAYYLFMSIFPFLIFLLNVLSYTNLRHWEFANGLASMLPLETSKIVKTVINDIIYNRSGTVLSLSLVLALYSASSAINQLIKRMNTAFDIKEKRNYFLNRGLSIIYTIFLVLMILLMLAGPIFGQIILNLIFRFTGDLPWLKDIWVIIENIIALGIPIAGFVLLYRHGPAFTKDNHISFQNAFIGSIVTTFSWYIATRGFAFYVNNFSNYANTYGSLAGVVVLLVWFFLSSMSILIGAEISATLHLHQKNK